MLTVITGDVHRTVRKLADLGLVADVAADDEEDDEEEAAGG